jgi:hypothetical protein
MDIFGNKLTDYQHFASMQRHGVLDGHLAGMKAAKRDVNFDALPMSPANTSMMDANEITAQAIGFVTNNLQAVQAEIDQIMYTQFRLNEFFTMNSNIAEGATSYSYRVVDHTGKGKFISQSGTDAGSAKVSMEVVPYQLRYGGIVAHWSIDELRNGVFGGIALDTETVSAATTGAMDHIEEVGLIGDAAAGLTGLVNNPDIPATTTGEPIASKLADDLVFFLQDAIAALVASSKEVLGRNFKSGLTLYLPTVQFADVGTRKLSVDANKSVWEYVEVNNVFTRMTGNKVQLSSVIELAGAGAGDTDRMLLAVNDKKVMEMGTPIMPRALTSQNVGFGVNVPVEYKVSGLNIKRPTLCAYTDGV